MVRKRPPEGVRQETDDDPLHNIKKSTILVGDIADGEFEPLGTGFVYVHTPIRYAKDKSKPDEKGNVYYQSLPRGEPAHTVPLASSPTLRSKMQRAIADGILLRRNQTLRPLHRGIIAPPFSHGDYVRSRKAPT